MKGSLQFILFALNFFILSSCQEKKVKENDLAGQGMIEIKSEELRNVIKEFYQENKIEQDKGIVTVDFHQKMDTSLFFLGLIHNKTFVKNDVPGFYAVVDGTPVLFYTGIEYDFAFDSLYFEKLDELLSPRLFDEQVDEEGFIVSPVPFGNPPVWEVKMVSGEITEKEIVIGG